MDDVGIAKIDNARVGQIGHVVFVVIRACMAEGKQGRSFTNAPWAEPRARAPLRTEVKRCSQYRNVGVDLRPVWFIGCLRECRNANKRQIQPAGIVSVTHRAPLSDVLLSRCLQKVLQVRPPSTPKTSSDDPAAEIAWLSMTVVRPGGNSYLMLDQTHRHFLLSQHPNDILNLVRKSRNGC